MEAIKIVSLELENVKRVKAVRMTPEPLGLTVIGGANAQGKTSVLDGIAYALGGERFRPSNLQREGGSAEARLEVVLSNGLKVERKGKNSALRVTDPSGQKAGQRLLDSFVEELALDLPKFLRMPAREKAGVLLRILGIEDQLAALDRKERTAYDERTAQGRIADQKKKYAAEMPEHHDAPEAPVSVAELAAEFAAVAKRNGERAAARAAVRQTLIERDRCVGQVNDQRSRVMALAKTLAEAEQELARKEQELEHLQDVVHRAEQAPATPDESTLAIEQRMGEVEVVNAKVRANLDKRKALDDAAQALAVVDELTGKVDAVRARRLALLASVAMPLEGLSVEAGELVYRGMAWDCMSSSEQVRAAVAIVRKLRPECGFVLLDGLERFDLSQMHELAGWLAAEGLQAIATRVSTGEECTLVIADGMVAAATDGAPVSTTEQDW